MVEYIWKFGDNEPRETIEFTYDRTTCVYIRWLTFLHFFPYVYNVKYDLEVEVVRDLSPFISHYVSPCTDRRTEVEEKRETNDYDCCLLLCGCLLHTGTTHSTMEHAHNVVSTRNGNE